MPLDFSHNEALPPLGRIPEFDVEDKRHAKGIAELPFITPEDDERFASALETLGVFAADYQQRLGIEPVDISPESIHILTPEDMAIATSLLQMGEAGGFYEPREDLIYLESPADHRPSRIIQANYAMAHETGHKLTPGLNRFFSLKDSSFILREGVADRFAQEFMHRHFLPLYFPQTANTIENQFRRHQPYDFQDLPLQPDEILYIEPLTKYGVGLSRIIETRIVATLEAQIGEDNFRALMQQVASKDIRMIPYFFKKHFGLPVWELLTADPRDKPPIQVLQELEGIFSRQ